MRHQMKKQRCMSWTPLEKNGVNIWRSLFPGETTGRRYLPI